MAGGLSLGLPRMHKEAGERRDFLPALVAAVADLGASVVVEKGIGSGMGLGEEQYLAVSPRARTGTAEEAFAQDLVLILRSPDDRFELLRPGATLISMLHFSTRPQRIRRLLDGRIRAVSLDAIEDDQGERLVVNSRDVAWNGIEAAFDLLEKVYPAIADPFRPPIRVTVLGAGAIGKHAIEAATKYGNLDRAGRFASLPGVEVTAAGRNLTGDADYLRARLAITDVLVDATQREDPSTPLIPNEWLALLPAHAVICDLVVDPYLLRESPRTVRGIEGIPQGNLDRYLFLPEDVAWGEVPAEIASRHRRAVASCYSWPGVHPRPCMQLYGHQLAPLLRALVRAGGVDGLSENGEFHERALHRAVLENWLATSGAGS